MIDELVNDMIPPLKPQDDCNKAVLWMEELRLHSLPLVKQGKFEGFITETAILDAQPVGDKIEEIQPVGTDCYILEGQHIYEGVKKATDYNLDCIAVLDEEDRYFGCIVLADALSVFSQSASVQSAGGVIVISLNVVDYSLSEISRLVEENDARILGSSIQIDQNDPGKMRLTLKINKDDLTHIIATLERFDYKVVAKYEKSRKITNEKERLDLLFRYLEA